VRLDHIAYVSDHDHVIDVVQRLGSSLGAAFTDGGIHPRFGTRNFILPLDGGTYLEVVCALDHPAADQLPFGRAVTRRAAEGGGWLGWVVGLDDISIAEKRIGRESAPGHRRRPDGVDLLWKQLGINNMIEDPQLPFFIEWNVAPSDHPSAGAKPGVHIERLEIAGDSGVVCEWLGEPIEHPLDDVDVTWIDPRDNDGATGLVAVEIRTPKGLVRID
jgi:hypothetical protein